MKSDSHWGSSSPRTRLDDTCLNVTDSDSHWRLNVILKLTDLTYNNVKHSLDKRFIGSEQYRYCSWKHSASNSRFTFDTSDSGRRGFM